MGDYKCNCDSDDPVLSEEVEKCIEEKLGEELLFLVAFGIDGKAVTLRPESVAARKIDFKTESISTTSITDASSASLVSYAGSHKCVWIFNGTYEEYTHPH